MKKKEKEKGKEKKNLGSESINIYNIEGWFREYEEKLIEIKEGNKRF